jgi:hypothetical protein
MVKSTTPTLSKALTMLIGRSRTNHKLNSDLTSIMEFDPYSHHYICILQTLIASSLKEWIDLSNKD